jgi:deazaflavin-dependent oxidoreductase (nitroreductase family)
MITELTSRPLAPSGAHPSRFAALLRRAAHASDRVTRPLAGRRFFPLWGVVHYRGRRTGREYSIPVAIGVTRDAFLIPLPFEGAQWYQNVLAAGECTVHWGGSDHLGVAPEVVSAAEAAPAFGFVVRRLIPRVGIARFLRLRRVDPQRNPPLS